jgi:hypothetical protein
MPISSAQLLTEFVRKMAEQAGKLVKESGSQPLLVHDKFLLLHLHLD